MLISDAEMVDETSELGIPKRNPFYAIPFLLTILALVVLLYPLTCPFFHPYAWISDTLCISLMIANRLHLCNYATEYIQVKKSCKRAHRALARDDGTR